MTKASTSSLAKVIHKKKLLEAVELFHLGIRCAPIVPIFRNRKEKNNAISLIHRTLASLKA